MHIAEVVTIAKSLPLLRLNTYKSLILSYSADYRRILEKKTSIICRVIIYKNHLKILTRLTLQRLYATTHQLTTIETWNYY